MLKSIKFHFFIISIILLVTSCGNNGKQEDLEDISATEIKNVSADSQSVSAQHIFNTIPGRIEIISLTREAQAQYNSKNLNDPDNGSKYATESSKAMNLGVYGADLNVTGVYEQTQESMLFLKCVNGLAKSLGVSNAFDEKMFDRMEANKENRDSTLEIISQSFMSADKFLKANGRPNTSALIVAGSWIESVYVACNTAKDTKDEPIIRKIFSQTESLKNLIKLLEESKIPSDVSYVITELTKLKSVLETKTDNVYTLAALKDVDTQISILRNKVIAIN